MAILSLTKTVTTTPASLAINDGTTTPSWEMPPKGYDAIITNTGAVTVYIGGTGLTGATNGYALVAGATSVPLHVANGNLWAVAASATAVLAIVVLDR